MNSQLSELYFAFVGMDIYDIYKSKIGKVKHVHFEGDKVANHVPELTRAMNNLKECSLTVHTQVTQDGFILAEKDESEYAYIISEGQVVRTDEKSVYLNVCSKDLLVC